MQTHRSVGTERGRVGENYLPEVHYFRLLMYDFQSREYVIFFHLSLNKSEDLVTILVRSIVSMAAFFIFRNLLEIHTKTLLLSTNLRHPSGQGSYVSIH